MKKSDTRLWKYVKPLIKGDYDLFVRTNANRNLWSHEVDNGRVQSIKINAKTGRLEVTVKCVIEENN